MLRTEDKGRILLENIWLIALIILIIGVGFAAAEYYAYGRSFVGEILISGGFFGVFAYLIVGRHEKYVLREDVLGLRPGLTLVDQLEGEVTFRDYFYDTRTFDWELINHQNSLMWSVRLHDTINMAVERNTAELVMLRECDIALQPQARIVEVLDKTTHSSANVQLVHSAELSTAVKSFYLLRHNFRNDREYQLKSRYTYPANMKKTGDYIEMTTPVYTRNVEIKVKLPPDFDLNNMSFGCYIMDTRYVKVRSLNCACDVVTRTVTITSDGPVLAGEMIFFKYFPST